MHALRTTLIASAILLCLPLMSLSQKKVVVLGSSTAFGAAVDQGDSSWVNRLKNYYNRNNTDNADTSFYVVGGYGFITYWVMPTNYTPPPGVSYLPNPDNNVDKALTYSPDVIIINLPTNDIKAGISKKAMMDNLRYLRTYIESKNVACFIATTQPRNDMGAAQKDSLRTLVDSITINFGLHSINFWDDLVTNDGTNSLKDEVRHLGYPDQDYHLNSVGHRYLFFRARDRNIFAFSSNIPLPVTITNLIAAYKNNEVRVSWNTEFEEPNTVFGIQRSIDGITFNDIAAIQGRGAQISQSYSWTDQQPLQNKSYYRLKIKESNKDIYTKILVVNSISQNLQLVSIFKDGNSSTVSGKLSIDRSQTLTVNIIDMSGAIVGKKQIAIVAPSDLFHIPIGQLSSGKYLLQFISRNNKTTTGGFIK